MSGTLLVLDPRFRDVFVPPNVEDYTLAIARVPSRMLLDPDQRSSKVIERIGEGGYPIVFLVMRSGEERIPWHILDAIPSAPDHHIKTPTPSDRHAPDAPRPDSARSREEAHEAPVFPRLISVNPREVRYRRRDPAVELPRENGLQREQDRTLSDDERPCDIIIFVPRSIDRLPKQVLHVNDPHTPTTPPTPQEHA